MLPLRCGAGRGDSSGLPRPRQATDHGAFLGCLSCRGSGDAAGLVVGHAVKAGIRPYAESGGRSWGIRLFGSVIFPEIFPDPPGLILIRGPPTDPVSVGALPPVMAGGSVGV